MVLALLALAEARPGEPRWLDEAIRLADDMKARFGDPAGGAFFYAAEDHGPLIVRKKDFQDGSVPSGNALCTTALLRLGRAARRGVDAAAAERMLRAMNDLMRRLPTAAGQWLLALDEYLAEP